MELPNENPVLAKVQGQTDLGLTSWFEVVWHNDRKWCSFCGSDTFDNGEQVVDWIYVDGIDFNKHNINNKAITNESKKYRSS